MIENATRLDVQLIVTRLIQDCITLSDVLRADREMNVQRRQNMEEVKEHLLALSPQAFSSELENKRQEAKIQLEAITNNLSVIQAHLIHLLNETQLTSANIEEHQQFLDRIVRHLIREKGKNSQVIPFGKVKCSLKSRHAPKK